jgi:hypothetical protein
MQEKKKYRLRGILRNNGINIADYCHVEAWWSPANITGTSMQQCMALPVTGGTTPLPAKTQQFTVNPKSYRETSDMLWDVPDLSSLGVGAQGTFKIILKAFYPGVNGMPAVSPNPALSPECDPCCAVRTITIVGV